MTNSEKRRIAVVVRSLKMGGMERAACNMADAFAAAGHDTHLIYFKTKEQAIQPRNEQVRLHHWDLNRILRFSVIGLLWELLARVLNLVLRGSLPLVRGLALSPIYRFKLWQLERRIGKFDLVLLRGQGTFELMWATKCDNTVRICVNIATQQHQGLLAKLQARALFGGARVALISEGIRESYQDYFLRTRTVPIQCDVVNNVFSLDAIAALKEQPNPDLPSTPFIVSIGRLVPAKNTSLILDAFAALLKRHQVEHHLYLVGEGSERARLEEQASQLGLADRIHFVGYQANPYVWFSHSALFVLGSHCEGLGGVLLEALACNTPMVVTNSQGGVHDVMGLGLQSYLCEFDPEDMADKMWYALHNPPSTETYQQILMNYDPDRVVASWLRLFGPPQT